MERGKRKAEPPPRPKKKTVSSGAKSSFDPLKYKDIHPSDKEFTKEERAFLDQYGHIYQAWGYRSNNGDHEKFEAETHHGLRWLQFFTDILFRNLQQYHRSEHKILKPYSSDLDKLIFFCIGTDPDDPYVKQSVPDAHALIRRFLQSSPAVRNAVNAFASRQITNDTSFAFVCLQAAADCLLQIEETKDIQTAVFIMSDIALLL